MSRAPAVAVAARRTGARVLALTARLWRRAVVARGVDWTDLLSGRRLLVLAPHPDDETLGCGATIARARAAGGRVTVVVATDGRHSSPSTVVGPEQLAELRSAELTAACRALGVAGSDVLELGYEDGTLGGRTGLVPLLADLVAELRPEVIFVPCLQDEHPDHRALHAALLQAVRRRPEPFLVLAYPVWAWRYGPWFLGVGASHWLRLMAWSLRQPVAGRWVRVACGPYLAAKRAALAEHASQTTNLTGEPSWSYLDVEDCSLFLQGTEVFLPILSRSTRDTR